MTHRITRSRSLPRRTAMTGMLAAFGATAFGPVSRIAAQNATPEATPSAADEISYLFVQSGFTSGILEPAAASDAFRLTLQGTPELTIWFSDRPNRTAGLVSTAELIANFDFEVDPPNAALLIQTEDGETDVIVVELTMPEFDPDAGTLGFAVTLLANEVLAASGLGFVEQSLNANSIPASFGPSTLFIDSASGCNWGDTHDC